MKKKKNGKQRHLLHKRGGKGKKSIGDPLKRKKGEREGRLVKGYGQKVKVVLLHNWGKEGGGIVHCGEGGGGVFISRNVRKRAPKGKRGIPSWKGGNRAQKKFLWEITLARKKKRTN